MNGPSSTCSCRKHNAAPVSVFVSTYPPSTINFLGTADKTRRVGMFKISTTQICRTCPSDGKRQAALHTPSAKQHWQQLKHFTFNRKMQKVRARLPLGNARSALS